MIVEMRPFVKFVVRKTRLWEQFSVWIRNIHRSFLMYVVSAITLGFAVLIMEPALSSIGCHTSSPAGGHPCFARCEAAGLVVSERTIGAHHSAGVCASQGPQGRSPKAGSLHWKWWFPIFTSDRGFFPIPYKPFPHTSLLGLVWK
jgi:hypothetical protein